jgi:SPP1 family predicted phage head-tail adaptor
MALAAGDLRERIVFLSSTRVTDRGFASETFSTVCAVWAHVRLVGGSNENTQDRRATKLALEIDIRYRADLTDEMRIVWRGRTFEIVGPLQINPIEGRMSISALEDESLSLAVDHITVSPLTPSIAKNATVQFTATCFNDEGVVVPGIVFWSTSDSSLATVNATTGLATGIGAGYVTITASCEGKTATATLLVLPGTVAEFVTLFNSLGSAAAGTGMTLQWGHLTGNYVTVAGGFCTRRENVVNPGDGNHLRPSPGNPSGAAVNGSNHLASKGLYVPGTAPYFASLAFRDDATPISAVVDPITSLGILPNPLFDDCGAGLTVINIGEIRVGAWSWRWGAQNAANTYGFGGDSLNGPNFEAMKDPAADCGSPFTLGVGSKMMVCETHLVHTQFGPGNGVLDGNFRYNVYGRDLLQDGGYQIAGNFYTNARDFFVLEDNGIAPGTDTPTVGQFIGPGAANALQSALLHNWASVQSWGAGLWKDTRDLGFIFGDSEEDPLITIQASGMDHIGQIVRGGFHGRAAISNFACVRYARSGNTPDSYQAPFLKWLARRDFSNRSKIAVLQWESNNMAGDAAKALAENYTWAGLTKATFGSKCKVIAFSRIYDTDQKKSTYEPAVWNDLSVNWPLYYDGLINNHDAMDFSSFNFGDGTTNPVTGPNPIWWQDRHPLQPYTQDWLEGFWYNGLKMGLGHDLSNVAMQVVPNVDHVALTVGGSTYTPTWTVKRYDGVTLGGRTLAFTSRDTSLATVDSSTGVITPGSSNGQVGIDCWSNDGFKGTIVAVITGAPLLLANFTAADTANGVPNADTGQVAYRDGTGLWGISSNQLYHSGDSGVDDQGTGYVVSGLAGAYTVTLVAAVIKWNMGLEFRRQDASNKFRVRYDAASGNERFFVEKRIAAAAWAVVGSPVSILMQNGDTFRVAGNTTSPAFTVDIVRSNSVVATGSFSDSALQSANGFGANELQVLASSRWDTLKVV